MSNVIKDIKKHFRKITGLKCPKIEIFDSADLGLFEVFNNKARIYVNSKLLESDSETILRETLAHELAHYLTWHNMPEIHNTKTHGDIWFSYCVYLQRELVWKVYYPEDYK